MYLLIEHNGTEGHLKIAEQIKMFASESFGATCEDAVSTGESITLYSDTLDKIAEFSGTPSDNDLNFYCALAYNEED